MCRADNSLRAAVRRKAEAHVLAIFHLIAVQKGKGGLSRLHGRGFLAPAALVTFLLFYLSPLTSSATGSESAIKGDMMTGQRGITETVEQIMEREKLVPQKPLTIEEMP